MPSVVEYSSVICKKVWAVWRRTKGNFIKKLNWKNNHTDAIPAGTCCHKQAQWMDRQDTAGAPHLPHRVVEVRPQIITGCTYDNLIINALLYFIAT